MRFTWVKNISHLCIFKPTSLKRVLLGDELSTRTCLNLQVTVSRVTFPCTTLSCAWSGALFKLAFLLLLYFFMRHIYSFAHSYIVNINGVLQNHGKEWKKDEAKEVLNLLSLPYSAGKSFNVEVFWSSNGKINYGSSQLPQMLLNIVLETFIL